MLVLSRKKLESIVIDGRITIDILDCGRNGVRLGITAPAEVKIVRHELLMDQEDQQMELTSLLASAR
jgi:carbon storage regulator